MTPFDVPPIFGDVAVDRIPDLQPCAHGLTARRPRRSFTLCRAAACDAVRRRVLDQVEIWQPRRASADERVLLSHPYGDRDAVASLVTPYAEEFAVAWAVLPSSAVLLARSEHSILFRDVLSGIADALSPFAVSQRCRR